jgi:hypothetical protein
MLPLGAFQQRGSVVGGRSMRLHGGGYEPTAEDMRLMDIYYAAMDAGLSQKEAEKVQMQAAMEATYGAPQVSVDTAGLTGAAPNIQGTPTIYYDAGGNVAGVLSQNGVVTPASMNTILQAGQAATAATPVQMIDAEGVRLYLRDANDPESVTYTNTGIPAIAGTLGESAYRPVEDRGIFGTIGSDFAGMAKDPAFWKFLASAAAITGGGLALNSAFGAGGLGAASGATAFPVADLGLLGATELGAAGAAGGTGALGAGGMSAAEAIALAAEGGLGAEFGVQGALGGAELLGAAGAGGLTDAQAAALMEAGILPAEMQVPAAIAGSGLTDAQAALLMEQGILPAGMQSPAGSWWQSLIPEGAAGSLIKGGLTLGGLAAAQALAPKPSTTGTGSQGLSAAQLQAIVAGMPSAMGNYLNMANTPYAGGVGVPGTANQNLVDLFPGFSLPTAGPYFGAGRFGDYYAPQALPTAPISPTGLV